MSINMLKKVPASESLSVQSIAKKQSESDLIMAQIRKDKGDNVVIKGNQVPTVARIPTGMFEFDLATGGGFPRGRYSIIYGPESSGKSNACYCAAAQAQRLPPPCNKVVWVDLEATFDAEWAALFGIDTEALIVVKPSFGEEAVDLVDALVRADDVALLVVDSLAVIVSSKEVQQSSEKFDVGTAAILVKRMCNKLVIALSEEGKRGHTPAVILINQTRFKIGVMFGDPECLHGDTLVNLADGSAKTIKEIVDTKHPGPVLAYNEHTMCFEPRAILSHHYNGTAKDGEFLTVTTSAHGTKNGVLSATTSITHKYLTDKGWERADQLLVGDKIVSRYQDSINGTLREFLLGTYCGDLTVAAVNPPNGKTACLKIEDSENEGYAEWKVSKLQPHFNFTGMANDSGDFRYSSNTRADLFEFLGSGFKRDPRRLFEEFSWLGMALWYMDDGHREHADRESALPSCNIAIGRYVKDPNMRAHISDQLLKLGLEHEWMQGKRVVFTPNATLRLHANIARYVPPCMGHKLVPLYQGKYQEFSLDCTPVWKRKDVVVTAIVPSSPRKYRNRQYYDIHVEGLNNYSVGNLDNGFVVHNTMPGGQTMKFLSSLTIRVYGKNKVVKEVHPDLAAFKETNAVIKKAKVPITSLSFEYDMCVYPSGDLNVGQTNSWNKVSSDLKQLGHLTKVPKGWKLEGPGLAPMEMPTLVTFQDTYQSDPEFATKLQSWIINSHKGSMFLAAAQGAAS